MARAEYGSFWTDLRREWTDMAKMPQKKAEENTGEWLNTYADMVTLLLTFFVLLFSCSNLDETKMQLIFQAFQSNGSYLNSIVDKQNTTAATESSGNTENPPEPSSGGEGDYPQSFEELHQYFAEYIAENDLSQTVSVENSAAYITLRFNDTVFFDGNSYMLKEEGKKVLNGFIPPIKALQGAIKTLTISGHTADDKTEKTRDMQLAALRANSVHLHMMGKNAIEYSKYRLKAAGPNEPIDTNDTLEGMAKNRRVEIIMMKNDLDTTNKDVIQDILKHEYGIGSGEFTPGGNEKPNYETLPEGSADKVIGYIDEIVKNNIGSTTDVGPTVIGGPSIIDSSQFVVTTEEETSE